MFVGEEPEPATLLETSEAIPPALPPIATVEPLILEENATPPPIQKLNQKSPERIVRPPTPGSPPSIAIGFAKALALSAPRPEYPYEARRQRTTGSGIALLSINPATGVVVNVQIIRSTGSAALDNATVSGFRRWRFKPGTVAKVQAPITFTLTGAAY